MANQLDFDKTRVQFLSLTDLGQSAEASEDLANFLETNKNCHVFIDEFPIPHKLSEKDDKLLDNLADRASDSDHFFWMTFRIVENHERDFERYEKSLEKHREMLSKAGFVFPALNINMRNSSNIQSSYESIFRYGKLKQHDDGKREQMKKELFRLAVSKASLPCNTVPGNVTKVIPVPKHTKVDILMMIYLKKGRGRTAPFQRPTIIPKSTEGLDNVILNMHTFVNPNCG